ncbi:MAG TPA: GNAT family N-acetyltransferase [Acidobacteriaceae bacterium]
MTTTIRLVCRADYAEWLPLWEGYNRFYGRFDATALPEEITRMTWSRFFDAYEPVWALVAELDSRLVGLAHYVFHRSTITIEPTCYLQDLFTAEAARGKGVGRRLIDAVHEQARRAGVVNVYWRTHRSNATARRLYDSVAQDSGFVVYKNRLEL